MKIVNSIMPMGATGAPAANGQKLRVAVTKTSAQGKSAQSTTPNLMSFSTDENSIWFNGKKYGIYILKGYESLSKGSPTGVIQSFLGDFTYDVWSSAQKNGNIVLVNNNSTVMVASVYVNNEANELTLYMNDGDTVYHVGIAYSTGGGYSISEIEKLNLISEGLIVDALTSTSSNRPLSAAMGKRLNDEKLAKTDVVNNLTTTDASKALSAAQGKALNDKFNGNKININFSATSNSADNATIKGYMGNIDGATLVNKLTYGANLVDSSSEDWVITLQEISGTKVSFTGIKFTGFNLYSKNVSVTISGSNYTNMTVTQGNRLVPAINNSLTSTSTSEALSAAQGKALNDRISGLGDVYRVKGTKSTIEEVYSISANAKLGDVWNIASAFKIKDKPYPANTNVVCIAEWSTSTTSQDNWDPLGGTVDLSTYVPKSDIVDNLSTSDSKKPLSAKQGLALSTMITKLEGSKETYRLLKTFESGTLSTQSEINAVLGSYSSFNAALNAGKVIHGVYKDNTNRMNTVAFSAFNDTANSRVRMFAILSGSTLLYMQATYDGTNWTSTTTSEELFDASLTIE